MAKMKKISSQGLLIVNAFGPSKVKTPHKRKAENVITKECILEEIKAKRRSGKGKVKRFADLFGQLHLNRNVRH